MVRCRDCQGSRARALSGQWWNDNPEKRVEYNARNYKKDPEARRAYARKYRDEHLEVCMANSRAFYAANKEELAGKQRRRTEQMRRATEDLYGGRCSACHNPDRRVLEFHHIGGKKEKEGGQTLYRRLLRERPKDIVLLCANDHVLRHA